LKGKKKKGEGISLELHDGIGQTLMGIKLHTDKLKELEF
jgi:signal transduction histidine kinase